MPGRPDAVGVLTAGVRSRALPTPVAVVDDLPVRRDVLEEIERWLSSAGDRKALLLGSPGASLVLRRVRSKPGRVGCWVQTKDASRREALARSEFRQPSPGDHWLRELDRPTAASLAELLAATGVDPDGADAAWLVDHVSGKQILGIAITLAAWISLAMVAVIWRVTPVIDVFEWLGGSASPKIAGGGALIAVALLVLLPVALVVQGIGRLRRRSSSR